MLTRSVRARHKGVPPPFSDCEKRCHLLVSVFLSKPPKPLTGYKTRLGRPFSSASLHDILKNPKYVGISIYNKRVAQSVANSSRKFKDKSEWIIKDDVYPPLVSREVFDDVQKRLSERKISDQSHTKEVYLLSGKIRCGICGCAYCGERKINSKGVRSYSYFCNSRNKHLETKCKNPSINRSIVEQFVLQKLSETVYNNSVIKELASGYNKYLSEQNGSAVRELSECKRELNAINDKIESTISLLLEMKSAALKEKLSELEKQREYVNRKILDLSAKNATMNITESELENVFAVIRKNLTQGTLSDVKQLIDIYVNSVTVFPDKVVVTFNFFPGIGFDKIANTDHENGECVNSTHSPSFSLGDVCSQLVSELTRASIYEFNIGKLILRRLRTDKCEPP